MKRKNYKQYIVLLSSSVLALISFIITYYLDPLEYNKNASLSAIPAFLLSIVILIIGQIITIHSEVEIVSIKSDQICETVKNYLHIEKIGTPQYAWKYIIDRLPVLEFVQNTSFNFESESETSNERLYDIDSYMRSKGKIVKYINKGLIWKDIGDPSALKRFRMISEQIADSKKYSFKLIKQLEPQIGFILLTYKDGTQEVLFNWDFRDIPQDPIVLLSRDIELINMFAAQYKGLWRVGVDAYDNMATKSTSKK